MRRVQRDPATFWLGILVLLAGLASGARAPAESLPAAVGPGVERSALAPGRFLVAARKLEDPNFSQAVVLLVDYDETGAFGLVVNRPTELQLRVALPEVPELAGSDARVFLGGPVSTERIVVLFRALAPREHALLIFDDVYVSSHPDTLRAVAGREDGPYRAYAGYAGWAPGQLDDEVLRGDWHIAPADTELVFDLPPGEAWPTLIERSEGRWVHAAGVLALARPRTYDARAVVHAPFPEPTCCRR